MVLKREATASALSRRLGKKAAQAKVDSMLAAEQLRQDELIKLRRHNIKLKAKIHRLEARLRDREELARDPVQVQYERLQAERLQMKKQAEKQNEEALKVERKVSGSLEVGTGLRSIHSINRMWKLRGLIQVPYSRKSRKVHVLNCTSKYL